MKLPLTSTHKKSKTVFGLPVRSFASIIVAVIFLLLYLIRPYATEAITTWPSWIWFFPGVIATIVFARKKFWKAVRWPLLAWLVVALFSSELWRVVVVFQNPDSHSEQSLRVVSFNAAGDMKRAITEVAPLAPDVLLLQQSAKLSDEQVFLAQTLGDGYTFVDNVDSTMIVRGEVTETVTTKRYALVKAVIDGRNVLIVSLRLSSVRTRLDYWNPACWKHYSDKRRLHESELAEIWKSVKEHDDGSPIIFGGDFNSVPSKWMSEVFDGDMTDAFRSKGSGWYGTALNRLPLVRIDQIWTGSGISALSCRSYSSEVSDHRYLVANLRWSNP